MPFAVEEAREGAHDVEAAAELLARFRAQTVDELEMVTDHPAGGAAGVDAAEELECGAYGYHDAAAQMGLEPRHEIFLLRSAQGHPDDVSAVGLDHAGDSGVVEVLDTAEGKFDELHAGYIGIDGGEVFLQSVQNILLGTEEDHAVAPAPDNISENLAPAVLAIVCAVDPADIERHITAVADGEHASVDHIEIMLLSVGGIENDTVGHADIVGSGALQPLRDGLVDTLAPKLIADIEIIIHDWLMILKISYLNLDMRGKEKNMRLINESVNAPSITIGTIMKK